MNKTVASSEEQGTIYQLKTLCVIALLLSVTLLILWLQVSELIGNLDRLVRDNAYVSVWASSNPHWASVMWISSVI